MRTRTGLAGVMGVTSALAMLYATPAEAHETAPTSTVSFGPHVTQRTLLTSLVESPLDRLEAWATALQSKVAAVPDDTVLTGRSRLMAKRQLAAAVRTAAFLKTVDGLTAEQQARVDAVRAALKAAAADLRELLANRAAVPVSTVEVVRIADDKVGATDRHSCDGWGDWDGWDRDRRWDGDRDGDRDGWWGDRDGWRRG